jgi:hypothetical protein
MFAALNSFQVGGKPTLVSEVFSTTLYTGNNSTRTITNGIDLSTKGGLVWMKARDTTANHILYDTARGAGKVLISNTTGAQTTNLSGYDLTAFTTSGYTIGLTQSTSVNESPYNIVNWTFREQRNFFDVVTYTGTGSNTTIAHSLDSVPGCIIVKRTDTTADWAVYHRSLANTEYLVLNTTAAKATGATWWNSTTPTSSVFSVGTDASVNASGGTYVAYLFAHDAGGFGFSGNDNVISCGSTNGSKVTLGYEPQWILYKSSDFSEFWQVVDNQRGMPAASPAQLLKPNTSGAETTTSNNITIASDGFTLDAVTGIVIYIAIKAS